MIEIRSKFDSSIVKPLQQLQMRKGLWLFILLSLCLILFGVLNLMLEPKSDLGMFIIIFGMLFFPLVYFLNKTLQKSANKTLKILNVETSSYFKIDENKIYQETVRGNEYKSTSESSYSMVYKVNETKSHFFIFISKLQTHVIPKKDIVVGTAEELSRIMLSKLGNKYKYINIK